MVAFQLNSANLTRRDRFIPLALENLVDWITDEYAAKKSIFGIPRQLFFNPSIRDPFCTEVYGHRLETPIGVAAGPHTQLAQNIVVAWLCGARFIELKTVQTLDDINVTKPCINMQDEGYNIEWSQELRVEESFQEYLHAWVLIHALHRHIGQPGETPGIVFNISVGYDLKGIQTKNMRWFLDHMRDAGSNLDDAVQIVAKRIPMVLEAEVPKRLSDNVTLSTLHGCPQDEIQTIAEHLLRDRGLHTSIKLNPTLLGFDRVQHILHERLGYHELTIPEEVFSQDLTYDEALLLLQNLQMTAARQDLVFGLKLTNTLPVVNDKRIFETSEDAMYLSGRPLHAVTVQLARYLVNDLKDTPLLSFSGGADSDSIVSLLRCGMRTVTVCSDLLRPGGYLRLGQYLENTRSAMETAGACSLEDLVLGGASDSTSTPDTAARNFLEAYSEAVLANQAFQKETYDRANTKTNRSLGLFDCIDAPCTDACGVDQKVPQYMRCVRDGDIERAAKIIREDNPLPSVLGRACHRPCELVCLRTHIDQPLAIREIKRFVTDNESQERLDLPVRKTKTKIAIIGGGPCGLSAAQLLSENGYSVTVFEARNFAGGMVSGTIPNYRAADRAVQNDLNRIVEFGVEILYDQKVGRDISLASLREKGFSYFIVAVGAQRGLELGIEGERSDGVIDGIEFLGAVQAGKECPLGKNIGVIGGGDVAMDCARSARRLSDGEVTVFYRRTRSQMPAQKEEIRDLLIEGSKLSELVAPKEILTKGGRLTAVKMVKMQLGKRDKSGRGRPEEVADSATIVPLDTLIIAIGQRPDLGLFGAEEVELTPSGYLAVDAVTGETSIDGIYAGGDIAGVGPDSIVAACGDGRLIAEAIRRRDEGIDSQDPFPTSAWPNIDTVDLLRRRSRRNPRSAIPHLDPHQRSGFDEVVLGLSSQEAAHEAGRCLDCDLMCSTCVSVCPNLAIMTYHSQPALLHIPQYRLKNGKLLSLPTTYFCIEQGPQVVVLSDLCNECGNCVTFCPTSGSPWRDKPRLFLDQNTFEAEDNNAFMLIERQGIRGVRARVAGETHELLDQEDLLQFISPSIRLTLEPETLAIREADIGPEAQEDQLVSAKWLGAMVTLLNSFPQSMPEYPLIDVS